MTTFQKQFSFTAILLICLIALASQEFSKGRSKELPFTRDTSFYTKNIVLIQGLDSLKYINKQLKFVSITSGIVYINSIKQSNSKITYTKSKIKIVSSNDLGILIITGTKAKTKK